MAIGEQQNHCRKARSYGWLLAIAWTVAVGASLSWSVYQDWRHAQDIGRTQALVAFDETMTYRRWNALHGGVYVPISETTHPNPYLNVPERDITTPLGRRLTLINPAYMIRMVHEQGPAEQGVISHFTSLKPLHPGNTADPWEAEALRAFERGQTQVSAVVQMDGQPYLRLMRPMITKQACLQCHGAQGYQVGDVRGGLSVSVPIAPLRALAGRKIVAVSSGHALLWLLGLAGITVGTRRAMQRAAELQEAHGVERERKSLQEAVKSMEQVLGVVGHELRTPLAAMQVTSEFLLTDAAKESDQCDQFVRTIHEQTVHMARMVNDMLDAARLGSHSVRWDWSQVQLATIAAQAIDTVRPLVDQEKVELICQVDPPDLVINGDADAIGRLLVNLLANAVRHTAEGSISVTAKMLQRPDAEWIELQVSDTGEGISAKIAKKLGEPFAMNAGLVGSNHVNGAGLGLAICKGIIAAHGGSIRVTSSPGQGARFTIVMRADLMGPADIKNASVNIMQEAAP